MTANVFTVTLTKRELGLIAAAEFFRGIGKGA